MGAGKGALEGFELSPIRSGAECGQGGAWGEDDWRSRLRDRRLVGLRSVGENHEETDCGHGEDENEWKVARHGNCADLKLHF